MDTNENPRRRRRPPAQKGRSARRSKTPKALPEAKERRRNLPAKQVPQDSRLRRKAKETRAVREKKPEPRQVQQRRGERVAQEPTPQVVYTPPKHQSRWSFLLKLGSMAAVVAAVFFCLSLFFRVETVEVAGAEKYTPYMIMEASGVEKGDSLLSIGEARVASRIISKLPYVDQVKVRVKLPGTVQIELTELQVTYAMEDEAAQWWLVSSDGRAVEPIEAAKARSYTRVEGLRIRTPEQGSTVCAMLPQTSETAPETVVVQDQAMMEEQLQVAMAILKQLEQQRIIGQVEYIDVSDVSNLSLHYPNLLTVRLGDGERLEHKIAYMAAAVAQLKDTVGGELDLSMEYTEDAIFTPAG